MSVGPERGDSSTNRAPAPRNVLAAGLLGTMLEYYDFILYGLAAALVFGDLFFPTAAPGVGAVLALSTLAVGFLARPIGAALFGHYGDRVGRKNMLVITLVIMGLTSLGIGLLPTFEAIGIWAPIILVILRIVQGISFGGEWGGAVLLVGEHGAENRRGFAASFVQVGAPIGTLLASLALFASAAVTTQAQFAAWGWRMPFLLGFTVALVGLYLRIRIRESPVFEELERQGQVAGAPILEMFRHHWRALIIGAGATLVGYGSYYVFTVVSLSYLATIEVPSGLGTNGTAIGAALAIPVILLVGRGADWIGRRPMYAASAILTGVWVFVFFPLLATENRLWIIIAIAVGVAIWAVLYGTQGAFLPELFPAHVRYTGSGLSYHISGIFGGFVPLLSILLLNTFGTTVAIAVFVAAMGVVSLLAVAVAPETRQTSLTVSAER